MSVVHFSSTKYFCDRCGAEVKPVSEFSIFKTKPVFVTVNKNEAYIIDKKIEKVFDDARRDVGDEEVLKIELSCAYSVQSKQNHLCSKCSKAFYEFMRSER